MKGRNKILISLLICDIVFIILLTIAGYFMYKGKTSKADKNKEQFLSKLKESNNVKSDNVSSEKPLNYRVDEVKILSESEKQVFADKIKEQFLEKLKESDNINKEKLLDYRVDEVKILSDSEKQVFNEDGKYSPKDILAFVKYSVKAKDIEKTGWIAGNGEIDGEWIINKTACECLRNGKLVKSSGFSTGFENKKRSELSVK